MLCQLSISNLAIAKHLDVRFGPNMTAISGETGAGKSVLLEALGIALGKRCQGDSVRFGAKRADVSAVFRIDSLTAAQEWLKEHELDDGDECILRRSISKEGRSRAYINGRAVTRNELKNLGECLMEIHSQHAHQNLLQRDQALELLDQYGKLGEPARSVNSLYCQWRSAEDAFQQRASQEDERSAQIQLLTYQVQELDELAMTEGEFPQLENEQKTLANAEELIHKLHSMTNQHLEGEQGVLDQLQQARSLLGQCDAVAEQANNIEHLLEEAHIAIQEACSETRQLYESIEINPERLETVDERLASAHELARKHRCTPETLPERHQALQENLQQLTQDGDRLEDLEEQAKTLQAKATDAARFLQSQREETARFLSRAVSEQMQKIGLGGELVFQNTPQEQLGSKGFDRFEILVSLNAGQPLRELSKVASGGELSRISLCIQVVMAGSAHTPTLVFDEVDVGIGGPTAEVIGRVLRELGNHTQILCITHLAQVASQAHDHLFVCKHSDQEETWSQVEALNKNNRVQEVARMLGGSEVSRQGLALAKELLGTRTLQ